MLETLRQKNPDFKIYSVEDEEFKEYGRLIKTFDAEEIVRVAKTVPHPEKGVRYVPTEEKFSNLAAAEQIKNELFGTLPTEVGYCHGHSSFLNATEWHTSSEINIAATPLVLFLAHVWEIDSENKISSDAFKAFYLPEGTVAEVFATTLHYCPCQVSDEGFRCVVGLPEGTNTALETELSDKRVSAKNKWIICHTDNEGAKARGVFPGIYGKNYEVKY